MNQFCRKTDENICRKNVILTLYDNVYDNLLINLIASKHYFKNRKSRKFQSKILKLTRQSIARNEQFRN